MASKRPHQSDKRAHDEIPTDPVPSGAGTAPSTSSRFSDEEHIELQVENEQLRETQALLEDSRERFASLFNHAPIAYVVLDHVGLIQEANLRAATLLGRTRDMLSFSSFRQFVANQDQDKFLLHLERCHNVESERIVTHLQLNTSPPRFVDLISNVIHSVATGRVTYQTAVIDHTALIVAQRNLQESRERYELLFNTMAEVFALGEAMRDGQGTIVDFRIVQVNTAWEQYVGMPASQAVGRALSDVLPQISSEWQGAMAEVMNSGVPLKKQIQGAIRDRWLIFSAFKVLENCIAVLLLDITERKRAEEALQLSEQEYRLLFEENPIALWIFDVDTLEVLRVNDAALAQYGYSREEFLSLRLPDLVVPEQRPMVRESMQLQDSLMTDGGVWKHMRKDGTQISVEIVTHDLPLEGRKTRLLHAKNVTARVRTEEALRQRDEQLRYHIENTPLAVIEWDAAYVVKRWSPAAERIFGWTAEECLGRAIMALNIVYAEDLPVVEQTMKRLNSGTDKSVVSENRNVTKDGRVINCIWYNSVLTGTEGTMSSVLSLVQDVTATRKATETLQKALDSFGILISNSIESMALVGRDGTVVCASKRAATALGYMPAELEGKHWTDFITEEQRMPARFYYADLMKNSSEQATATLKLRTAAGDLAWFALQASIVSLGDGDGYLVYLERVSPDAGVREEEF